RGGARAHHAARRSIAPRARARGVGAWPNRDHGRSRCAAGAARRRRGGLGARRNRRRPRRSGAGMTGALPDTTRREPPRPSEVRAVSMSSYVALGAFALSAALLIPLAWWIPGGAAWLIAAAIVVRSRDTAFRLRMGALLV